MSDKPLLTDYLYLYKQLEAQGYNLEPQPEDEPGECSFLVTSHNAGLTIHLKNLEQVQGLVSSECCFKFTKRIKHYEQNMKDLRTLKKELDKDDYCIQSVRSILSEILK